MYESFSVRLNYYFFLKQSAIYNLADNHNQVFVIVRSCKCVPRVCHFHCLTRICQRSKVSKCTRIPLGSHKRECVYHILRVHINSHTNIYTHAHKSALQYTLECFHSSDCVEEGFTVGRCCGAHYRHTSVPDHRDKVSHDILLVEGLTFSLYKTMHK